MLGNLVALNSWARQSRPVTEDITEDRRVVRTCTAINQALMDLIAEREYDDITVGDIIGRADVGRSTFYQHYQNKDEVFAIVDGGMEVAGSAPSAASTCAT